MSAKHRRGMRKHVTTTPLPTPIKDRERLILRIARKLATLENERRAVKRRLVEINRETKAQRYAMRLALQAPDVINVDPPTPR